MITATDIVTYRLTTEHRTLINKYAKTSCIGGVSRIHHDRSDRMRKLLEDNVAGQTGNLYGNLHIDGDCEQFVASRELADKNPHKGDGGKDRIGCGIDFKCSLMRAGRDPLAYRMLVRPKERHPEWVYVQLLIAAKCLDEYKSGTDIYLLGWAHENDLPDQVEEAGPFAGAYMIPVRNLRLIKPFPQFLNGLENYEDLQH